MLSRKLALLLTCLSIGFVALCYAENARGYLVHVVPALPRPFQDMRIMLEGAGVVATNGFEGFWKTVDAKKLSYNYPRTWAGLGFIGVGPALLTAWTTLATVSWAAAVYFIFSLMRVIEERRKWIPLFVVLFLNPAVFLALERANTDLLIFGAVTLMLGLPVVYARPGYKWMLLPCLWILILLKLYPVFLLPIVWLALDDKPRLRIPLIAGAVVCVVLLLPDLVEVARRTQQVGPGSYGVSVVKLYAIGRDTNYAVRLFGNGVDLGLVGLLVGGVSYILAFGGGILVSVSTKKWMRPSEVYTALNPHDIVDRLWLAGSLIYAGTFLLGANYDYRLIFLLLTLPWHVKHGGRLAMIHVTLLLALLWGWYLPRDFMPARCIALIAQWLLYFETVSLLLLRLGDAWWASNSNDNRSNTPAR